MLRYSSLNKLLYPYRNALLFSFLEGVVWLIASATPMLLLLQELGATPFQVGLAYSFGFLMLPLQVVSTVLLHYLGYKTQVIFSWFSRSLFLLVPFFLAFSSPVDVESWMTNVMIWGLFFFALLRAFGSAGWYPWLYAIVPKRVQGLYFSVDQTLVNGAGVIVLILASILFYVFTIYQSFTVIYGFAILASFLAIYNLFQISKVRHPDIISLKEVWEGSKRLCSKASPFRYFLIISLIWFLVGTPFIPFTIYYLNNNLGLSDGLIIFYTGIQYLGAIMAAWIFRGVLDRFGVRLFFIISLITCIVVKIYWLLMLLGMSFLLKGMSIAFFCNGLGTVLWQIAYLKYIPQLSSKRDCALGVSLQTSIVGVVGGLAPILWGVFFGSGILGRDIDTGAFIVYFIVAIVVLSVLIIPYGSLKEMHLERPSLENSRGTIRLFRFITKIGNLIDKDKTRR